MYPHSPSNSSSTARRKALPYDLNLRLKGNRLRGKEGNFIRFLPARIAATGSFYIGYRRAVETSIQTVRLRPKTIRPPYGSLIVNNCQLSVAALLVSRYLTFEDLALNLAIPGSRSFFRGARAASIRWHARCRGSSADCRSRSRWQIELRLPGNHAIAVTVSTADKEDRSHCGERSKNRPDIFLQHIKPRIRNSLLYRNATRW